MSAGPGRLSASQKEFFRINGFLHNLQPVYSRTEIAELNSGLKGEQKQCQCTKYEYLCCIFILLIPKWY